MHTLHVRLSDPFFATLVGVAKAQGQSVEDLVAEEARRRTEEAMPIRLTPEQFEICARAEAQIDAGEFYTVGQIRERFVRLRDEGTKP